MDQFDLLSSCTKDRLGANWEQGKGTHFRVSTGPGVNKLDLVLFAGATGPEHRLVSMQIDSNSGVSGARDWCAFVPDARPGDFYGYLADGWWNPEAGYRHDSSKLLADPAGRLLGPHFENHPSLYSRAQDGKLIPELSLLYAPRSVIANPYAFDWRGHKPHGLYIPPGKQRFYEGNVRGLTIKLSQDLLGGAKPGTYSAIGSDYFISHLKRLNITVLELYVVQQSLPGFGGFWNYNPLLLGAPDNRYASNPDDPLSVDFEFKDMTRNLLDAGVELCLDVVFNHGLEGNENGPTLCQKGLDNHFFWLCGPSWNPSSQECYHNWTGVGNTFNYYYPPARRFMLEMLRRWVLEYRVGMFRYDLAGAMFSNEHGFDKHHPALLEIEADPVLSPSRHLASVTAAVPTLAQSEVSAPRRVHIAEPWSCHGARCHLQKDWGIWDDFYRDNVRQFWLGAPVLKHFIEAITGSRNRFHPEYHGWYHVVNSICCHDGFSLAQWLMFNEKSNRDGHSPNYSYNCGCDGHPNNPALAASVLPLRMRIWKAAFASLAFSPSPLLRAGDEMLYYLGSANNNPYAEGDEVNGIDWGSSPEFLEYAQGVMGLLGRFPSLGRMIFTPANSCRACSAHFGCFHPLGLPMEEALWNDHAEAAATLYLPGVVEEIVPGSDTGNLLLMVNGSERFRPIRIPWKAREVDRKWTLYLHTGHAQPFQQMELNGEWFQLEARSLALFVSEPRT